jgi:hypothetical protein
MDISFIKYKITSISQYFFINAKNVKFRSRKGFVIYSTLCVLVIFTACNPDLDYTVRGYTQKIIVEGTVETGEYPRVYLTLNVPLWKTLDSATVLDHVIRYAKVSVSDGITTEILTSKWDKTHFPPYVYTATEMKGIEGRNYSLKVEYSGYTVYSNTLLPTATTIDSVHFQPSPATDTLKIMSVWLNIDKRNATGFRIFTKKQQDKRYIETPIVFNNDLILNGVQKFNLSPQPEKTDSSYREGKYFAVGDIVDIKLCTIDKVSTLFFNDLSLYSSLSNNLFTSEVKPIKSNITEPGFGIWYGSGVRYFRCVVK